nr:ankyrin repeat-containing protein [Tanacetum cinerariifolium]
MTKITDLEASFEQYKEEQTSIHAEAKEHRNLLQETMNKNKVESDQQFAEIIRVLKTLQPATTAVTVTTTPPPYHSATTIPPSYTATIPSYTATMPPPQYSLTQPLIFQQYPHPPSAAYTSFSRLRLDSQGYPIPTGSTNNFNGPFSTGEYSNHQNHKGPVSTEGVLQNFSDFSLGSTGGMFTGPIRTSLPNHGPDHGWGSGTDYRTLSNLGRAQKPDVKPFSIFPSGQPT